VPLLRAELSDGDFLPGTVERVFSHLEGAIPVHQKWQLDELERA
jgi:hypothetical protein